MHNTQHISHKCSLIGTVRPIFCKPVGLNLNLSVPSKRNSVIASSSVLGLDWNTLNNEAYLIGKGVILFTMFYCSLNWITYKTEREKNDFTQLKKDKKNKKNKKN